LEHVNNPNDRVFLKKLTEFTIWTNMWFRETHYKRGFFVHDSSTIWFLLYPHLYRWMFGKVMVETKWEFTKWKTLVDMRNFPKTETNAYIVTDIDYEWFLEAMTEDFKKFDFDSK
jgi:inosine-uridine nucleoside N-ribohydrolase